MAALQRLAVDGLGLGQEPVERDRRGERRDLAIELDEPAAERSSLVRRPLGLSQAVGRLATGLDHQGLERRVGPREVSQGSIELAAIGFEPAGGGDPEGIVGPGLVEPGLQGPGVGLDAG